MKQKLGFTFIEIVLVLAIISIIALFALPNWQGGWHKSLRLKAQIALHENALWLTQFYNRNHSFMLSSNGTPATLPIRKVVYKGKELYHIKMQNPNTDSYILFAIPQNKMVSDVCGTLSLDNLGEKGAKQRGCWP